MIKKILSAGCSFTYGHELSDCNKPGSPPSQKTWAAGIANKIDVKHYNVSAGGIGNQAIARKVFQNVSKHEIDFVLVMWTFPSRYDWAMPRHKFLEDTRWASITPWDTDDRQGEVNRNLLSSEPQQEIWKKRREDLAKTGVKEFANSLYRYAANQYHEIYLSWKSITWLQNILIKKDIPFLFTLADNSLFYHDLKPHAEIDQLMTDLHGEIDFTNWYFFGERNMGFNQWAMLNEYPRGTTHPLDKGHQVAVQLIGKKFFKILKNKKLTIKEK